MKKLLVLAAGILQVPVIRKAHEMGFYVIAADENKDAIGFQYADKSIVANIMDENMMFSIAQKEQIDGVIHPCSEVSMYAMGHINDRMNLNGISREVAVKATNKHIMRKAFDEYGAPSPKSYLPKSMEDAWQVFHSKLSGNAILKPSRNSGSRGVAKIGKDIGKYDFEMLYNRALHESRDNSVLIEQFVEGAEFSVEIIIWNNDIHILAVTDKKTTGSPFFVELGHSQPSCYPAKILDMIKDAAYKGVKALGLNNCAAHAEIKIENDKPYIMEIGARLGGDFIATELTYLSTGIDMVEAAINVALGIPPNLIPKKEKEGACIRYFCPSPGILRAISNTELLQSKQVYQAEIYRNVGDSIPEVKSSLDRSGHIIVVANTVGEAIAHAEYLIEEIHFEVI